MRRELFVGNTCLICVIKYVLIYHDHMSIEKAILAGGCFWGVEELFRHQPGVISTVVGYTGGDVKNATYRNHGTHAEGIEIQFDPAVISYRKLL